MDENGFVVSVESVPERASPTPSVRRKRSTAKKGRTRTKSTTSKKKSPAGRRVTKVWTSAPCPVCGIKVSVNRLGEHRKKFHAGSGKNKTGPPEAQDPRKLPPKELTSEQRLSGRRYVRCSSCGSNLRESNWEKHLRKAHPSKSGYPASKSPSTSWAPQKKGKRGITTDPGQREKAIRSLLEETSFGDKYLGQARREPEGRFGSLPLYDDYSEESGPD